MDRRLGGPLPRQPANPTQAHPIARGPRVPRFPPWGVCGISVRFHTLSPTNRQIPTRYSPVRHSSASEDLLPFDLHVLSIPPAFNLSHDQTLQFNYILILNKISIQSWLDDKTSVITLTWFVSIISDKAELSHIPTQIISILTVKEPGQLPLLSRCILQNF